jgi:PPK2 family polyphosphate:nucleotide phosphotransferase
MRLSKKARKLAHRYRIRDGAKFRLKQWDPDDTAGLEDDETARELLAEGIQRLADLHGKLYAQDRWSLLLIFQAMDAAGKDSTIKHVFSGLNPVGCQVASFKEPTKEELDHDFLWRVARQLPERGTIGIFNRSHYEETLIVRVHPEILAGERVPPELLEKDDLWEERFDSIRGFEKHLARNGTVVLKFFLNVSREEQRKRFLARIDEPAKNWKFQAGDVKERERWDDYMRAYEEVIRATAKKYAPWYVVPADHKWFMQLVVAAAVADALEDLDVQYPKLDAAQRRGLAAARRELLRKK